MNSLGRIWHGMRWILKLSLLLFGGALILSAYFYVSRPHDEWVCTDNGWVARGRPPIPKPSAQCPQAPGSSIVKP